MNMKIKSILAVLFTLALAASLSAASVQPYKTAKEGYLIQASGDAVVIHDGKRRRIPNMEAFNANGLKMENVTLPAATLEGVTESGKPLAKAQGVSVLDVAARTVRLESGRYEFAIPQGNQP
jgi:hypothetical protein